MPLTITIVTHFAFEWRSNVSHIYSLRCFLWTFTLLSKCLSFCNYSLILYICIGWAHLWCLYDVPMYVQMSNSAPKCSYFAYIYNLTFIKYIRHAYLLPTVRISNGYFMYIPNKSVYIKYSFLIYYLSPSLRRIAWALKSNATFAGAHIKLHGLLFDPFVVDVSKWKLLYDFDEPGGEGVRKRENKAIFR